MLISFCFTNLNLNPNSSLFLVKPLMVFQEPRPTTEVAFAFLFSFCAGDEMLGALR
jgi:hypothetical protein